MQRSSSKLGRLCHPPSSLRSLQRRTVTHQSSDSLRSHGAGPSRGDQPVESLRGFLQDAGQARVKDEWDVVMKGGSSVIDRAANWAHAAPMRRRRVPPQGIPQQSAEKILRVPQDTIDHDVFDTELGVEMLPKGSFLEIRRNGAVVHAVAMGQHYTGRAPQIHTLTAAGVVLPFNHVDVTLCVPGFVDNALVDACGETNLHTTKSELAARSRVLAEMRVMENEIERASRYVDNRAAKLYDHLKSPDPHEWNKVDIQTVARFFRRPNNPETPLSTTIAVHKHLMDHPAKFLAHPTAYRETQTILVRPQAQTQNIADITNWMRVEGGRTLNQFCDKAKSIMEQAKALRQQSTSTIPHEIPTNYNHTLTDTDREILRFLSDAFHSHRLSQSNPHSLPCNYILKRLDLLRDDEWPVNQLGPLLQLLTDLGVFSPWIDGASFGSRIESLAHRPTVKPLRAPPYPQKTLGPEDFYASDHLEDIRHDFGDMPVYVIDDPSASELDDGLSLETIPSEPDNYWVHVHVADPTTLLPPTHTLSYKAREVSESSYLVQGTRYMLPPSTFGRFSLGRTAATGEPQQVMTFSFKVDAVGDLVDYEVRAAAIKNVHVMTYDAVDATLGLPSLAPKFPFEFSSLPSHAPIDPSHVGPLKRLYEISSRLVANRARLPIFNFANPTPEVRFTHPIAPHLPSPSMATDTSTMTGFKLYNGFPDMSYSVLFPEAQSRGARVMVSEFMKAASRAASRFGVENGTPLLRRHGPGPTGPDPAEIEKLIASRDEFGMVDYYEASKALIALPRAVNTLAPLGHWALGVPDGEGYVRVTSPLRRYADLVAHWQIKHTLLANSNPARYTKGKRTVFGESWLSQYARELTLRDRERKRTRIMDGEYWRGVFLRRWLEGDIKSGILDPRTAVFEARPGSILVKDLGGVGKLRMRSMVSQLGVWGDIPLDEPLEVGSRVNVRITGIKMGARPKVNLELV